MSAQSYTPSHADFFVEFMPGAFCSGLRTKKAFAVHDVLAKFEGLTRGPKAYTSVQCGRGPDDHMELNSDLVYINHSCEPNVAFDLSSNDRSKWHVRALREIHIGDTLTFFYPSTEWEMEQPFECQCKAATCLGVIKGANYLSINDLTERGFINPWILELAAERDRYMHEQLAVQKLGKAGRKLCVNCGFGFLVSGNQDWCGCQPHEMM